MIDSLEPDAVKAARPVLRGEGNGDVLPPTRLAAPHDGKLIRADRHGNEKEPSSMPDNRRSRLSRAFAKPAEPVSVRRACVSRQEAFPQLALSRVHRGNGFCAKRTMPIIRRFCYMRKQCS